MRGQELYQPHLGQHRVKLILMVELPGGPCLPLEAPT